MGFEQYLASGQTGDNVIIGGATYTIATFTEYMASLYMVLKNIYDFNINATPLG